jgi:hypothetical protein
MAVSFNTACCMRPDCQDTNCPGRAMAQEHFGDGGHKVEAGQEPKRLPPPEQLPQVIPRPRRGAASALLAFLMD